MGKPRDTSTSTSTQTTDTSTPVEQVVQPIEQQPLVDSFTGTATGDEKLKDPVIINR